jgi:hypothetical protein
MAAGDCCLAAALLNAAKCFVCKQLSCHMMCHMMRCLKNPDISIQRLILLAWVLFVLSLAWLQCLQDNCTVSVNLLSA